VQNLAVLALKLRPIRFDIIVWRSFSPYNGAVRKLFPMWSKKAIKVTKVFCIGTFHFS